VSTVQVGCEDSRVLDAGLRIVNQLLSRGIFEVELLADGDALYAIDLNPRAFGFLELDIARGFDLPWLWFRSTIEQQTPAPAPQSQVSIEAHHRIMRSVRVIGRAISRVSGIPFDERRDSNRTRQFVYMVGSWSDPLPMIVSYCHLLRHPRSFLRSQFAPLYTARLQKLI
jgi:hypothetical protein